MLTNSADSTLSYYVDSQFEKIDKFYLNLKNSDLYKDDFAYMLICDDLGTNWESESAKIIKRYIESFVLDNEFIKSIYLYSMNSDYVYSAGAPTGNYLKNFQDNEIILKKINKNGFETRKNIINYSEYDFITIQKKLVNDGTELGRLIFNIDEAKLLASMRDLDINLEDWFIVDNDGVLLYSSNNETEVGKNKEEYEILRDDALNAENIRHDNTVTTKVESISNNVTYIFVNKYESYSQSRRMYIFSTVLIGLLMLALGLVISAILTVFFYDYLSTIVEMLQPYTTLYDIRETSKHTTREMQLITNSILVVTSQNKDLREELSNRLVSLKKAQSSMLQMQINPHFLHNTLNTINAIVIREFKGDTVVSDMITNLAEILRYSLNTAEYLVTLDMELMYLNTYIEIQRVKYNNKFSVEYNIEEEVKKYKVLKLSLQPLVENAITHGIIPKNRYGTIKITAKMHKELFMIEIEDDGVGIPPEKLKEINRKMQNEVFMLDKSLGIDNTAKRIRLIFGDEYGLKISTSESGTKIILTIPKIM